MPMHEVVFTRRNKVNDQKPIVYEVINVDKDMFSLERKMIEN